MQIQLKDEPLRFTVRNGLVIHRPVITEIMDGFRKVRNPSVEQYGAPFGRTSIELPAAEVPKFAHALEPTDERSAAALEALHFRPPAREPSSDDQTLQQLIDAKVAAALAAYLPAIDAALAARLAKPQEPRSGSSAAKGA